MGFNQSSSSSSSSSSNSSSAFKATSVSKSDLFGAVLAGFGIWTTPSPTAAQQQPQPAASNIYPLYPPLPLPLRVIRVKDGSPQMAGRMVISGRMADVCAELDRLAA